MSHSSFLSKRFCKYLKSLDDPQLTREWESEKKVGKVLWWHSHWRRKRTKWDTIVLTNQTPCLSSGPLSPTITPLCEAALHSCAHSYTQINTHRPTWRPKHSIIHFLRQSWRTGPKDWKRSQTVSMCTKLWRESVRACVCARVCVFPCRPGHMTAAAPSLPHLNQHPASL